MPDTFFRNERRGAMHNVLVPNLYVRIYADGGLELETKVHPKVRNHGEGPY